MSPGRYPIHAYRSGESAGHRPRSTCPCGPSSGWTDFATGVDVWVHGAIPASMPAQEATDDPHIDPPALSPTGIDLDPDMHGAWEFADWTAANMKPNVVQQAARPCTDCPAGSKFHLESARAGTCNGVP